LRKVTRVRGTVNLRRRNLLGVTILLSVQFPTILSKNQEDWGCRSKVRVETNFDRSFTQNHTFTGTLGRPKDVYLGIFGIFRVGEFWFSISGDFPFRYSFCFSAFDFLVLYYDFTTFSVSFTVCLVFSSVFRYRADLRTPPVSEFRVTSVTEKRTIGLDIPPTSVVYLVTSNWTSGTYYFVDPSCAIGAFEDIEFAHRGGLTCGF
jgi:hypothetical protein